jgi:hypothetical protein
MVLKRRNNFKNEPHFSLKEPEYLLQSADKPPPVGGFSLHGAASALLFELVLHGSVMFGIFPEWLISPNRWWIAAIPAAVGFMCNVAYASLSPGRYLNWPMAMSAIPFVFPGMAFWATGFPSIGVSIASIVWTSPATDALQPFSHGDRNEFAYAFDVVVVVCNFVGCIIAGVFYVQCAFDKLAAAWAGGFAAWYILLWVLPITVWTRNSKDLADNQNSASPNPIFWERGAIVWHIAASGTCFVGGLLGHYVSKVL